MESIQPNRMGTLLIALLAAAPDAGNGWADFPAPPVVAAPTEPPPTPSPESSRLDKLNGFQKAEWGMTEGKVRGLFPGGQLTTRDADGRATWVLQKTTIGGLAAGVGFYFEDETGGLSRVIVRFDKKQRGSPSVSQLCDGVKASLRDKYGEPFHEEATIGGATTLWRGEKTIVGIECTTLPIRPRSEVMLEYFSREAAATPTKVESDDL